MKKFALAAVAAAAMMAGGAANAYTSGTYSNGFVVPNVVYNSDTQTTAVGIINRSGTTVPVYWVFHNVNSGHVTDGCFPMTSNQYKGLSWGVNNPGADMSGAALAGVNGYLVFAVGATTAGGNNHAGGCGMAKPQLAGASALISANAFQVDVPAQDVAVVPVIDGPLTLDPANQDLTTLGADSVTAVAGAAQVTARLNPTLTPRYAVTGNTSTVITVWSTGNHKGTHTVNLYDDKQDRRSVNFVLKNNELDLFNPADIVGRPAGFTDGFIEWKVTPETLGDRDGSVFVYSTITARAFGAVQTLLGASH